MFCSAKTQHFSFCFPWQITCKGVSGWSFYEPPTAAIKFLYWLIKNLKPRVGCCVFKDRYNKAARNWTSSHAIIHVWNNTCHFKSNRRTFWLQKNDFIPVIALQLVLLTLLISTQFSLSSLPNNWIIAWLFGLVYFQKHLGPTYKSVFLKSHFYLFENVRVYMYRISSGRTRGGARRARPAPLIFRPNWGPKDPPKKIVRTPPPPPLLNLI